MIAIPTKGTAYVHPIETPDVLELIKDIDPSVLTFFNEDTGSITTNYYWAYNDHFEVFPKDSDGTFHLPDGLIKILSDSEDQ
ncbi:hypothetical protein BEL04_20400 [Mucilaginibacter sp. PPCGB 2223]|uniref:hypothetical protein n=1 Tax=Mucilaginibacter sp. PPCGB 2223 TaxID=1886027 RepID=UPI000824AAED|nr:hypothetical protein [Mucilaginibacter sp. PPCGB 2223]OCX51079.1 hypothetical protein BEL04_20400 [Mucilaginibacter sp. PPCGB 2223]